MKSTRSTLSTGLALVCILSPMAAVGQAVDPWGISPPASPPTAGSQARPGESSTAPGQTSPAPVGTAGPGALGPGMAALARAGQANRYLLIFFHNGKNEQTDAMWAVYQSAMTQAAARAEQVAVNITDPAEQQIVHQYGVDRAPMPLVLAVAPNGAIMGGFPTKFEETQLLAAFGTPGMEQTMKFLQERRLVFVCVRNPTTEKNEAAMYGIQELQADPDISGAVRLVYIDPADPNEARFLVQLQVDPTVKVAQTVMLAPPGSAVGKFMGGTTKTMLLSKLQASGGCGPGGCAGGKCGPPAANPQSATAQAQQPGAVKRFFSKVAGAFSQ